MDRYKKLFSNSVVFAIGNLGSKMITFFMVPLYTRYLTTSEYGTSDLISTLVSLLTPIFTLSVIDAVFRFAMDKNSNNKKVLTNGFFISTISFIVFLLLTPFIKHISYGLFVCFLTYVSALESMLQQFARGIGRSKLYAFTGLLMTLITVISNIILLVNMGWLLKGYLLSLLLAQLGGFIFLFLVLKCWNYIDVRTVDKILTKKMLAYSIPMIPNTISWWLSNSANKVFISVMLTTSANGIYAVANKIPSFVSVFVTTFTQAWQISAIEEFRSKDSGKFFSQIMNLTVGVLFIGISVLTLFAKPIVSILSTPDYFSAWKIVPWLALAVLYSSLASFLGTIYTSSMQTRYLFVTTVCGALANILSNLVLVPIFGLIGAGISAAFAFLIVSFMRFRDSRKFIKLRVDKKQWISSQTLFFAELCSLYLFQGLIGYGLATLFTVLILVANNKTFVPMFKTLMTKFKK